MLITIFNWVYYSITFWVLGSGFAALWNKRGKHSINLAWTDSILIGFCLSLIISLWASLYFPLDMMIQIAYIVIVLLVLVVLVWKKRLPSPKIQCPKNVLVFSSQMFVRSLNSAMINEYGVFPADYPNLPTYPCEIYNKTILCAELYNECWYAPFPCIPTSKPQAVMRGHDFRSGFRLK